MEPLERLREVFKAANEHMAIPELLDPELLISDPDPQSIMTWLSLARSYHKVNK